MAIPRLCLSVFSERSLGVQCNAFNYSFCPSSYLFHSPHLTSLHLLTPSPINVTTGGVFVKTLAIDRCLDCPHFFHETPRHTAHRGRPFGRVRKTRVAPKTLPRRRRSGALRN